MIRNGANGPGPGHVVCLRGARREGFVIALRELERRWELEWGWTPSWTACMSCGAVVGPAQLRSRASGVCFCTACVDDECRPHEIDDTELGVGG